MIIIKYYRRVKNFCKITKDKQQEEQQIIIVPQVIPTEESIAQAERPQPKSSKTNIQKIIRSAKSIKPLDMSVIHEIKEEHDQSREETLRSKIRQNDKQIKKMQ